MYYKIIIFIIILIFIIKYLKNKSEYFDNLISVNDTIYGKFTCFSEDKHICNSILKNNNWEIDLSYEIEKYYKSNTLFIDVGANYGTHSLYIANKIKKNNETGKVYSFEIQSKIYNLLLKNIRDNNLDSIIIPIFNGLGNTHAIIDLIIPKDYDLHENPGGISLLNNNYNTTDEKISTSIITLDSLNLDMISVMKIDVEGYEIQVLEGAINTIKKNKPYIILEIWPMNKEKYLEWFKNNLPYYDIEIINGWDYILKPKIQSSLF